MVHIIFSKLFFLDWFSSPCLVTSKKVFWKEVWKAECTKKRRLVKSVISRSVPNQIPQNEMA